MNIAGYEAERAPDGSLIVKDVPVFVECERGDNKFTRQWLERAFQAAQQHEGEHYLPPMHIRHHGKDDVQSAGFFRVTRLGQLTLKGKVRAALFADLIFTQEFAAMDVLAMRLPYRSVEIFDVKDPMLNSLALLDHEPPYLEMPMLKVNYVAGDDAQNLAHARFENPYRAARQSGRGVVASFSRGDATCILFQDEPMTDDKPDEKMEDDAKDGEDMADGEDTGDMMGVDAMVKAIKAGDISLKDFEAIRAAMAEREGASEPEMPTEDMPAVAASPGAGEAMQNDPKQAEQFARMSARIDAQDAELNRLKTETVRKDAVAAAMERLEGRPMGKDPKAKLTKRFDEMGAKAFGLYVDDLVANFAAQDTSDDTAGEVFGSQGKTLKGAEKFQAISAEAATKANEFAAQHKELFERGHTQMSAERYVELNMAEAGFEIPA